MIWRDTRISDDDIDMECMRKSNLWLLILLQLLAPIRLLSQSSPSDTTAAAVLSPGDIVRIAVWRRPEFSGDYIVAPDSSITHPLLREVKVGGVPFAIVEDRIRAFLTRFDASPAFVVSPLLRVFVGGEVRQPNVYNVPPGSVLAQLIALAGGVTDRGQLDRTILVRRQHRQVYDLTFSASPAAVLEVRSGDQILVERRRSLFSDVILPSGSLIGAAAAITSVFIQLRK